MRKHNGMRPQDIPVLLKIVTMHDRSWQLSSLSNELFISLSETSESLNRSRIAGLIDYNKKTVYRASLMEFLEHGIQYVFPAQPGTLARGFRTAHSHDFMQKHFESELNYVWPDPKGDTMGMLIEPFYPKQVLATQKDSDYYKLLALIDVLRLGKLREVKVALKELNKIILHEPSH